MYILEPNKKRDPVVRWHLPDRIFFGHGACHILAGVFLQEQTGDAFSAYWIKPHRHPGMHIFVSDGQLAFDYHGYSVSARLEVHHRKVWTTQYPDWSADIVPVDFDLLDTVQLNRRNMRGPEQYLCDAETRARLFLRRINHKRHIARVRGMLPTSTQQRQPCEI